MARRYDLCKRCSYYIPTYNHFPCTKCDGKEIPLTCYHCRNYPCKFEKKDRPHRLDICDRFMWN
jgi:hypothetical protein